MTAQAVKTQLSPPIVELPQLDSPAAHQIVSKYIHSHLGTHLRATDGEYLYHDGLNCAVWQFFVVSEYGPVGTLFVNTYTNQVVLVNDNDLQLIRERTAILEALKHGQTPLDENGHVFGEYARRQAESYIGSQIGMFFNAVEPLFISGETPIWQVTIIFQMIDIGPFTLGVMDVNAITGEPISVPPLQIENLEARAHAIIEFYAPQAETKI